MSESLEHAETGASRRRFTWAVATSVAALMLGRAGPVPAQSTYNVGSTTTAIPFAFLDATTGSIKGVMVDVIKAIAKEAGFAVTVRGLPYNALVPSLTSNKIDIIAAALNINPALKEIIDFSEPVYAYGEALVVARDPKEYKTLEDLRGEVVGVQADTDYVDALRKSGLFKEVKVYAAADMLRDVDMGRLKAGFGDYPTVAYQLAQGTYPDVRLAKGYRPQVVGRIGIGVRKDDKKLLAKVNGSLAKLKADGTTDRILATWKVK